MTFKVLVLCAANICRSPTIAEALRQRFDPGPTGRVEIETAGTDGPPGVPWCSEAQTWAVRHELIAEPPDRDLRSRLITRDGLEAADLVLAADAEVRAAALRIAPRARPRMFSLAEAADLGEAVVRILQGSTETPGFVLDPMPAQAGEPRWDWLATQLDAGRGLLMPTGRAHQDPVDAHLGAASHQATMRNLQQATIALADVINHVQAA